MPESQLQNASKLDDRSTKESVETVIKESVDFTKALIRQKEDFVRLCNGRKSGTFFHRNSRGVVIRGNIFVMFYAVTENSVTGKITFSGGGGRIEHPFKMDVNVMEKSAYPVTGTINNASIPATFNAFVNKFQIPLANAQSPGTLAAYDFLRSHRDIAIRFEGDQVIFFISYVPRFEGIAASMPLRKYGNDLELPFVEKNWGWLLLALRKWEPKTVISRPEPVGTGAASGVTSEQVDALLKQLKKNH